MEVSFFIAKVFGLYLLIMGIAMFVNPKSFHVLMDEMIENPAVVSLSAILALIIGLIVVVAHNVWVADWRVVVTLLAWLTLIKGALRLFIPQASVGIAKYFKNSGAYYTAAVITLILGIFLTYVSFFSV